MEAQKAYSIDTFCKVFDIGRTSVFAEIKAGRLAARKRGRRTLIRIVDAESWVNALPERVVGEEVAS